MSPRACHEDKGRADLNLTLFLPFTRATTAGACVGEASEEERVRGRGERRRRRSGVEYLFDG